MSKILISNQFEFYFSILKYLNFQETLKLQFGTYTGEVRDGKPHGQGVFNFNPDDLQVNLQKIQLVFSLNPDNIEVNFQLTSSVL